jgi:isochorismate synthase EntC
MSDAAVDDAAEADLKVNPKDAAEHQVVVDAELEALSPLTGREDIRRSENQSAYETIRLRSSMISWPIHNAYKKWLRVPVRL